MQIKLGESVIVVGATPKDAEFKTVRDKQSSLCKFGLKVGERAVEGQDKKEPIWCNCVCWHAVARATQGIVKGDVVFAIGKIQEREHEGKTYKELVCDFVAIMGANTTVKLPEPVISTPSFSPYPPDFEEITGSEDSLPF